MKFHRIERLQVFKASLVAGICTGLVACAGPEVKEQKQAPGKTSSSAARPATASKEPTAMGAPTSVKKQVPTPMLGESVAVPGTTQIETSKHVAQRTSIPTVEERVTKADINRMSEDAFMALGMNESSSKEVVRYRQQVGPFQSVDQLRNVPGVDLAWYERLKDRLAVS